MGHRTLDTRASKIEESKIGKRKREVLSVIIFLSFGFCCPGKMLRQNSVQLGTETRSKA